MNIRWEKRPGKNGKTAGSFHRELVHTGCPWDNISEPGFNDDLQEPIDADIKETPSQRLERITPSNDRLLRHAEANPPDASWYDEEPQLPPKD